MTIELKVVRKRQSMEDDLCPFSRTVHLIGDKWSLLIIRDLLNVAKRFGWLQNSLGRVSPKTLSERLKMLDAAGLINRTAFAEIPPRVEYSLTERGAALADVIHAMEAYGTQYLSE